MNRSVLHIAGIFLLVSGAASQQLAPTRFEEQPADSATGTGNGSVVGFDRNLNSYLWTGRLGLAKAIGDFSVDLTDLYKSSAIITSQKFIKDEESLAAMFAQNLNPLFRAQVSVSSLILSDNRALGISEASSHQLLGGVRYRPTTVVEFTPMIGIRYDDQLGIKNQGLSYLLTGKITDLDVSGYTMDFQGKLAADDISPRKGESNLAGISITKVFSEQSKNLLKLQFLQNRRDFYFTADTLTRLQYNITSNIDSRRENIFALNEELTYRLSRESSFLIEGDVSNRRINRMTMYKDYQTPSSSIFDANINEFRLETLLQFSYTTQAMNTMVRLNYSERDEAHTAVPIESVDKSFFDIRRREEEQKDNTSRKTAIGASLSAPVTVSDRIDASFSASILHYDTPSSENVDDRDELFMVASLGEDHVWSPSLKVRFGADMVLNHMVYLHSERSANNNWNRIIRFSPRADYTPTDWFHSANTFEVLANYTVYDFEQQVQSVKSYSFRQFSWQDSTTVRMSQCLWIDGVVLWKFYETGQLFWEEFRERPANYFTERSFFGQLRYTVPGVTLAMGVRMFSQKRYISHGDEREFDTSILNIGPTCSIEWAFSRTGTFSLQGWYEMQRQSADSNRSFSNLAMRTTFSL